jgi:hypothetical protein
MTARLLSTLAEVRVKEVERRVVGGRLRAQVLREVVQPQPYGLAVVVDTHLEETRAVLSFSTAID